MRSDFLLMTVLTVFIVCLCTSSAAGQNVEHVPSAFELLSTKAEVILIENDLAVPTEKGHLQGIQWVEINEEEKLLISGSSRYLAYLLKIDLAGKKAEKLIPLMKDPFRHAGGMQVEDPYLAVGIEDNVLKTTSKVRVYDYREETWGETDAVLTIERTGAAKQQTAGATGILALENYHLMVVANWDSRSWDFYKVDLKKGEQKRLWRFAAPADWASYQSINLLKDKESIYVIGFYRKGNRDFADLILVSSLGAFSPIMSMVSTKEFQCKSGADFNTAAGLQIDQRGQLHIWATQRDALKRIVINRFSQYARR